MPPSESFRSRLGPGSVPGVPPTEDTTELHPPRVGLHDALIDAGLDVRLEGLAPGLVDRVPLDPDDAPAALAQHLEHLLASTLSRLKGKDAAEKRARLVDLVMAAVAEARGESAAPLRFPDPLDRLLAVHATRPNTPTARPDTPLARSALLTGTRLDPSLASQLRAEILHADRVDFLCSFVKWSGLRLILAELETLTSTPHPAGVPRLRVISTSYMGATDPEALARLLQLPNSEVRVSYDTKRTRLHAKAYLIHRATNFGSAYVGSANLSHAALSEGLEWTTKVSQHELPHLWARTAGTFETYWNDPEFKPLHEAGLPQLKASIAAERGATEGRSSSSAFFDLQPYPFQEEILDTLAAERENRGKHRHLVVAATGTGKTVVAAFDYRRFCEQQKSSSRPRLLFVAHRREILDQARDTFRAVLRDHNFGDTLAGGEPLTQTNHLFCTIQSFHSRGFADLPADHFDYVVVDEFHHAEAATYTRLLDALEPRVLLGLTATPERADGGDVLRRFGGETSCEVRLPDAIDRRLLCPFQYFGVTDTTDLSAVEWKRGGYDLTALDGLYTGNDVRAGLVVDKVHEYLLNPVAARGLGFCVSVAHANFMARFFDEAGLPALAVTGETEAGERSDAKSRLARGDLSFLFTVDLYNEGVDIPEVDTVLFLRPTESLTVYLQQLGRGLRLHRGKDELTVLDFIGEQRREFRFAQRLRALSSDPTRNLSAEVESGFPHLPAGCSIRMERLAQRRVLDNLRATLDVRRPQLLADLRAFAGAAGRPPSPPEFLAFTGQPLGEILKRGLWSRLLHDAGLADEPVAPDESVLSAGLHRLSHLSDPQQLRFLLGHLEASGRHPLQVVREPDPNPLKGVAPEVRPEAARRWLTMLHVTLWGGEGRAMTLDEAEGRFGRNPTAAADLRLLLSHLLATCTTLPIPAATLPPSLAPLTPLTLHATYTRDEALAALGFWDLNRRPVMNEGVLHLAEPKLDVFFVTLQKTESGYSPTTMYDDYAISRELFHWQSQNATHGDTPTGKRYVHHRAMGYTPVLFVREGKKTPDGRTAPYAFLGPCRYVSHTGASPMSVTWRLDAPMPSRVWRAAGKAAC